MQLSQCILFPTKEVTTWQNNYLYNRRKLQSESQVHCYEMNFTYLSKHLYTEHNHENGWVIGSGLMNHEHNRSL
jgi:hypothetical protein